VKKLLYLSFIIFSQSVYAQSSNALWNSDSGFGIWLYQQSGSCEDLRKGAQEFVVISPPTSVLDTEKRVRLYTQELKLCTWYTTEGPKAACGPGYIELNYNKNTKEFSGSYAIQFAPTIFKKGSISASYCKSGA
jgi:hypothetical protein